MKLRLLLAAILVVGIAEAKTPPTYEKGALVEMESAECGVDSKDAQGIGGILGVDNSVHTKSVQMLCQQYLLQSDHFNYKIRPTEKKHPALLPIGQQAEFRIVKDRMMLHVAGAKGKDRAFTVVAISQRADADNAAPAKVSTNDAH